MRIRKAELADLEGIIQLNQQITQLHSDNEPKVFMPPTKEQETMLENAEEIKLEVMEFNGRARQFYSRLEFTTQSRILNK